LRLYNTDNSKSLDREEMLALLAEDNVMRAKHTSSFEPTLTYKGSAVEAGALVVIDGYTLTAHNSTTNVTTSKTELAGSVLIKAMGADVSFQFDMRNGGSYSIAASKTWEFDWGVFILYGSFGSGDCNDNVTADAITLKTAIAGKLTLTEFKKASFGFSGKYYCLGGHAGRKWEITATTEEMSLMESPKRLKLKNFILEVYNWKDPTVGPGRNSLLVNCPSTHLLILISRVKFWG